MWSHFYPRPPRGGRPTFSQKWKPPQMISIHALREEGDRLRCRLRRPAQDFYPRPPRGGRRRSRPVHPCRRDFYPRPPRGGRPPCARRLPSNRNFYPRPPRGGRPQRRMTTDTPDGFLSTPSARRATPAEGRAYLVHVISIHALREEGDNVILLSGTPTADFYPRPPRGGRPPMLRPCTARERFLSTPSARRATCLQRVPYPHRGISIHALREEGDGRRRPGDRYNPISIHALREEGDS